MIDITSVFASNIVGFLLMASLLLSRGWRIQTKNSESGILLVMIFAVMVGCVFDPIASFLDGQPGNVSRIGVYVSNTLLFFLNIVIGPGYITLIERHINERQGIKQKFFIYSVCAVELLVLIINIFYPVVFYVNENNSYCRLSFYWLYIGAELFFLGYGLYVYIAAKRRGRFLKYFPAWQFLVPIIVGMIVQSCVYGISLIWPCVGVAFCEIAISLQNESIYLDKLTGAYNRFYLDEFMNMARRRGGEYAALMLDMNGFKKINDNFSHAEGDNALIAIADILSNVVRSKGVVIRFAGDEFIIVLDSVTEEAVTDCKKKIAESIDEYNETSGKPYKLSAAVGGSVYDFDDPSADFISNIDKLMYADKAEYYKTHDRRKKTE
ncbi:GGDEF domain-containing protein [Butyrivibrio sp. INlla21]|uniref:GGDEF domain-containing protein n=1 Tax=Butyrivibrio sp. INlla21 TaxID=1520811 RepID=UPI0008E98962|nr:GGDEF domain-containing protein [Butyrivibrio sp. INlla21]SFU82982.1 diguanylate cyclase (GGDEF) domain-containing protein [Butyrivibrio sp. INlla21]